MATGTAEFSDKEEVVVEVVAGEAAQTQATEEGEKLGEIQEYVAPPVIVEEVKEVVEEAERLVEEVEVAFVVQAVEETKAKVVELYQLEFNEYTSQEGGTVKAHIWKVQGGLAYMELENGPNHILTAKSGGSADREA